MQTKIWAFMSGMGIVKYSDQIRFINMFICDSEDWLWVQLYDRFVPITKTQYILKHWKQFTSYVNANKHLYFKYIKHVKN
jgi:hypothetical protein